MLFAFSTEVARFAMSPTYHKLGRARCLGLRNRRFLSQNLGSADDQTEKRWTDEQREINCRGARRDHMGFDLFCVLRDRTRGVCGLAKTVAISAVAVLKPFID